MNEQPDELLIGEVAKRLRKRERYVVNELIKKGKLPARKEGREWRVKQTDLEAYITSTRYRPPGEDTGQSQG